MKAGSIECALHLLEHGANPTLTTRYGATALSEAIVSIVHGNPIHISFLDKLITLGVDLNQKDLNNMTSLAHSFELNTGDVTAFLLSKGAEPHECSGILHMLAVFGNIEIVEVIRKC